MTILISYHNFVRDFRGSLLLKYVLRALGHRVWVTPHWNRDTQLAILKDVDVIVGCQVSERSTAYLADFARETGLHLVLNASEHFGAPASMDAFISYDRETFNDDVIAFQSVACSRLFEYIEAHPRIKYKDKYKFIGFPRFDLSADFELRSVETAGLASHYRIPKDGKRLLYLSSFLFEETFRDVPREDMERWKYSEIIERNRRLAGSICRVLKGLVEHYLGDRDVLLIKKHPWDMSDYLARELEHPQVRFIEQSEYVVPCIDMANVVLHSFSTAAIEAWVMQKPTIAVLPAAEREALELPHMRYEVRTEGLDDTLAALREYPSEPPWKNVDEFLCGRCDGLATVRLAREIHRLPRPVGKRLPKLGVNRRIRGEVKFALQALGLLEAVPAHKTPKLALLAQWERQRRRISRLYAPHFRAYVRRHRALLQP